MLNAATPSNPVPADRLHYLDWLRVIIIGMVFFGHSIMPFSGAPWLITADARLRFGPLLAAVGNQFAMPVMFLIAGAGAYFSLRKRASARFARERLLRLGLPYLLFTLLLSPIQAYYAARNAGTYGGPFFPDFLPRFFNLDGFVRFDLSFLGHYGYHLWFLGFLLFFSLASLPVISYLKGAAGQRLTENCADIGARRGGLLLLFLPFALLQVILFPLFPQYQGWANTAFWGSFFILGYLFYANPRFVAPLRRDWKIWASAAAVTTLAMAVIALLGLLRISPLINAVRDNPGLIEQILASPGDAIRKAGLIAPLILSYLSMALLFNYNAWSLGLLVMAIGMIWLNFENRTLKLTSGPSMPFYIFHHPVIVVLGYYIVQLSWAALPEFLLLAATAFVMSCAVVAFFIAPWNPLSAVLGVRQGSRRLATPRPQTPGS
jgi:glucans biosynthesis protein C